MFSNHIYDVVIDTDAANETDDQFALIYALAAEDVINVKAVYAAPFKHYRVLDENEGMENSYWEIKKILSFFEHRKVSAFKGARKFLSESETQKNEAVNDLIERAEEYSSEKPLLVVAIASLTNIATAISIAPHIAEKIVLLWLGAQKYDSNPNEFNLEQDVKAAQIVFDSNIKMILFPCNGVSEKLYLSLKEANDKLSSDNQLECFLKHRYIRHHTWSFGELAEENQCLAIWDFAPIAYLINKDFCKTELMYRPALLTKPLRWEHGKRKALDVVCTDINRNAVFDDFYQRLKQLREL